MNVDFSTPSWLIFYLEFMGTFSFFLNLGTIYLIIWKSETIDNFRYFLLVFQILCTHSDLLFNFLMQPMPLSPLLAGYCNGLLSTIIWANYLISFLTSSFIVQIECLVFCFIRKHQTIAKLTFRHVISDIWYVFGTTFAVFTPCAIGFLFSQSGMKREEQMDFIRENLPEYTSGFASLQNFVVYSVNPRLIIMLAITSTGGLLCAIIFILLTLDMLKMLKDIQRKVSVTSFRRYRVAVTSLLAQFSTSFLLSVPLFIFLVLAASQIENSNWAAKLLVAVMPLYSPVNAMVLVMTTPPYRNFVLRGSSKPNTSRTMFPSPSSLTRLKSFFSLN